MKKIYSFLLLFAVVSHANFLHADTIEPKCPLEKYTTGIARELTSAGTTNLTAGFAKLSQMNEDGTPCLTHNIAGASEIIYGTGQLLAAHIVKNPKSMIAGLCTIALIRNLKTSKTDF